MFSAASTPRTAGGMTSVRFSSIQRFDLFTHTHTVDRTILGGQHEILDEPGVDLLRYVFSSSSLDLHSHDHMESLQTRVCSRLRGLRTIRSNSNAHGTLPVSSWYHLPRHSIVRTSPPPPPPKRTFLFTQLLRHEIGMMLKAPNTTNYGVRQFL